MRNIRKHVSKLLKIFQLNYGECLAAKLPGNSRKKIFEPLVKKAFSRKFIIVFRKWLFGYRSKADCLLMGPGSSGGMPSVGGGLTKGF